MSVASKGDRSPRDHYITPIELCNFFAEKVVAKWDTIFDIGAGDGRIGRAVFDKMCRRRGPPGGRQLKCNRVFVDVKPQTEPLPGETWIADEYNKRQLEQVCSLKQKTVVVSNPPYSLMEHPYDLIVPTWSVLNNSAASGSQMWYLLRLDWLGARKRSEFIHVNPPAVQGLVTPRPKFMTHLGKNSTDSGEYAWFGWETGRDAYSCGSFIRSWIWKEAGRKQ